jgi:mono/diheme cytochrome c family protein
MKILLTVLFTILGFIVLGIIFIYSGLYNVSAMNQDKGIIKWVLETTSDKSVDHHSDDITVPNLNDSAKIEMGLSHYKEMCEGCHRGPGTEETELAKGLNPPAPNLYKYGKYMNPKHLFWVTKNGIKMTGMPAWGKTHSDDKIWAIVAAVKKLNSISPEKYNSIKTEDEESEENTKTDEPKLRYH